MAGRCITGKTVAKIVGAALIVGSFFLPVLLPVTIPAVGGFLSVAGLATLFRAVGSLALSIGFAPEIPGIDAARQLAANLTIQSDPLATRSIPFGRVGIAGQVLFHDLIKNAGTADDPDEALYILGLAGYPANSLEQFWLNGQVINIGGEQTADTDALSGAITTGKFANDLWVWFRTGQNATAAFPAIAALSPAWAAKVRKLRGIPSIGIRIKVREKLESRLEPLAQIKGAKLYDPRLDSTVPGGAGLQRFATPTTWAWSANPKLAELLYIRGADVNGVRIFGAGKSAAAIDLEGFASEANICEEQIAVNAGGTIDRYTCNGLLIPSPDHRSNLQQLLSASAGTMDASGGIYRTFAGAWRASSMTLTESDIDGAPTDIQLQKDQSEEVNILSGSFADPNDQWQVKEYPQLRDETSITQIGESPTTLDLPFTNDHRIAQRISKIVMKRLNAARLFAGNYWLRAASLQPGDIVTQTYARYTINAETFRVQMWGLAASPDRDGAERLIVSMSLIEEQQSWFAWDAATEEKATVTLNPLPPMNRLPRFEPGADVTANHAINAIDNPEFEAGDVSWTPSTASWTIVNDAVNARRGSWCAQVTNGPNGASLISDSRLQVAPGDRVLAQAFFKRTAGTTGGIRILIVPKDATGASITQFNGNTVTSASYAASRALAVMPANAVTAEIRFQVNGGASDTDGFGDGAYMAIILQDADIDAIGTTNGPIEAGADVTPPFVKNGFVTLPIAVQDDHSGPLPQSAGITFASNGEIQAAAGTVLGRWFSNAPQTGIGSSYEVRNAAQLAGVWDFAAAAVGTWVTMSSDAAWSVLRTAMEGIGTDTANSNFQIRQAGSTTTEGEVIGGASAGS